MRPRKEASPVFSQTKSAKALDKETQHVQATGNRGPMLVYLCKPRFWMASTLVPQAQGQTRPLQRVSGSRSELSSGNFIITTVCLTKRHDKAHSYAPERIVRGQARLPGRSESPRLSSEDKNAAQRLCGPQVLPLCHALRFVGDQRGHSEAQPPCAHECVLLFRKERPLVLMSFLSGVGGLLSNRSSLTGSNTLKKTHKLALPFLGTHGEAKIKLHAFGVRNESEFTYSTNVHQATAVQKENPSLVVRLTYCVASCRSLNLSAPQLPKAENWG